MRYLSRVRKKCLKLTAKYFPVCAIRILALRGAGYSVGRDVYIGEELHVTDELEDRPCPLAIGDRVAALSFLFSHFCFWFPDSSRHKRTRKEPICS